MAKTAQVSKKKRNLKRVKKEKMKINLQPNHAFSLTYSLPHLYQKPSNSNHQPITSSDSLLHKEEHMEFTCSCLHSCYLQINQSKTSSNHQPEIPVSQKIQGQAGLSKFPKNFQKFCWHSEKYRKVVGADDVGLHQIAKADQLLYPPVPDKSCKLMVNPRFIMVPGKCIYW